MPQPHDSIEQWRRRKLLPRKLRLTQIAELTSLRQLLLVRQRLTRFQLLRLSHLKKVRRQSLLIQLDQLSRGHHHDLPNY